MTNLDSIFKSRDITLPTKVRLVKAMVFTVVMYGCESWTVKKAEHRRIDAFELWCWRRLLRVPWTARRSNQSIPSVGARRIAANARRALDLFTTWFGPLPGNPSLTILELEDGYGSQADVAAIMQTAAAFRDSTRDHELYHEVAHLWNPPTTDLPSPRWNEGLSTFLEYLAEEQFTGKPLAAARADQLLDWLRSVAPRRERLTHVPLIDYGKAH